MNSTWNEGWSFVASHHNFPTLKFKTWLSCFICVAKNSLLDIYLQDSKGHKRIYCNNNFMLKIDVCNSLVFFLSFCSFFVYLLIVWLVCLVDSFPISQENTYQNRLVTANRPFYCCVLSCQAFDLEWGWRWPGCDRDQYLVGMITK